MVWAIWITGLPGSGKSTISNLLMKRLKEKGIESSILSIDTIREKFKLNDYNFEGRKKAYNKLIEEGLKLINEEKNVIFDATSNYSVFRNLARAKIENFAEIYLKCPIQVCMDREFERDEKKAYLIYKQKKFVPGLQVGYEEAKKAELILETDKKTPKESVELILEKLEYFFK